MPRWPKLALFLSGLFFGGALDHVLFAAFESPTSHYGLQLDVAGQLGFAALDVTTPHCCTCFITDGLESRLSEREYQSCSKTRFRR
jgi:hypothetical protein